MFLRYAGLRKEDGILSN